ncbi:MAG TPA: SIMPL domain-containing protein [Candidatus Angelobacter sp.]|nr:SIMPL domain-containing protein [Candidatus Angelobacter sp.]
MKIYAILFNLICLAGFAFAQEKLPPRIVRVVGAAEVKVVPDRAIIELGVQKQDPNAGAAKRAADAAARRILAALRANGIDDRDVQTTYLSLQPESYVRKGVRVSYFVAQQTLNITVRDLAKLDVLLEALVKAGGNRIDSIAYETSELRKYRDQARDMAVKAAREKAAALAQALGQEVGKAHSIEEVPETGYERTRQVQANAYAFDENGVHARSIAPGQTSISASVIVSFDLN